MDPTMPPPPGGGPGAPPSPPGGAGPAAMPGAMPGMGQQGMAGVKVGLEALQKALPQLPMGSKLHQSVLKAVADIGKNMEHEGGGDPMAMIQQLIEAARNAKQNPNPMNMAAMMPGAGAAPPGPPPGM